MKYLDSKNDLTFKKILGTHKHETYDKFLDIVRTERTRFSDGKREERREGRIEGEQIGLKRGKFELEKTMKADNMSIEMVIKYSRLSQEEIEKL